MKDDERQTGQTDRPQSHYTQVVVTLNIACIVFCTKYYLNFNVLQKQICSESFIDLMDLY